MTDEEVAFLDAEQYQGGHQEVLTFKDLVMKQLQKIANNANCEFTGGYWQQKVTPMHGGNVKITEEYIQDTREVYNNSIEFLHDINIPYFDKQMKDASLSYIKKINELLKFFMKDGKFTDEEKAMFRENKVIYCRALFQELCRFLKRVDYHKGKTYQEVV